MAGTHCSVCNEHGFVFTLREIHLTMHIQGVGQIVYPARRNGRAVSIHVCHDCNDHLSNMIPKAVEEYHLEDSE
jgi:methionine aminopeptidase